MLFKRLLELRKEKDLIQEDIAKILGITRPAYSAYESGKRNPDYETLLKLAGLFNVTTDYLLGKSNIKPINTNHVPILGLIRAGLPILAEENWEDEIEIPGNLHADFALRVKGDSMSWVGIHDGDLALMRQIDTASHGMIVAAGINGMDWETTLKFYIQDNGHPVLRPANPAYEDIKMTDKHRIIGQLVNVIKAPPSINSYKNLLGTKEMADQGWAEAIETAVQMGFDGKELKKAVEVLGLVKKG